MKQNKRERRLEKVIIISAVMFFGLVFSALAQGDDLKMFDTAVVKYRAKENQEALKLMRSFREKYPASIKADDALWYLGLIYKRLDELDLATKSFQAVLNLPAQSNRAPEAAYDLGKIYSKRKEYKAVIKLLEPFKKSDNLDRTDSKILLLTGQTWYNLGIVAKRGKNYPEAKQDFLQAADAYKILFSNDINDEKLRWDTLRGLGKSFYKLMTVAENEEEYKNYQAAALDYLESALAISNDANKKSIQELLDKVRSEDKVQFKANLSALGGTDTLVSTFGSWISGDATLLFPLNWDQRVELTGAYTHNDFTLKTFNFPAAVNNDPNARLIQTTDKISAAASWVTGIQTPLYSKLKLTGSSKTAEDQSDNYWSMELSEKLNYLFNPAWKAGLDVSALTKIFPNYLSVNKRKLDYYLVTAFPNVTWYLLPELNLNMGYTYQLKQYLDAKYYLPDGSKATQDKQYQRHMGSLRLKGQFGAVFSPSLGYTVTYNKTYHDNEKIKTQIITDYFDYVQQEIALASNFTWWKDFTTSLKAAVSFRYFLNYPARDTANQFTGNKRFDTVFKLDFGTSYNLWPQSNNSVADLLLDLRLFYKKSISNMTYEQSFATNYQSLGLFAGVTLLLP